AANPDEMMGFGAGKDTFARRKRLGGEEAVGHLRKFTDRRLGRGRRCAASRRFAIRRRLRRGPARPRNSFPRSRSPTSPCGEAVRGSVRRRATELEKVAACEPQAGDQDETES